MLIYLFQIDNILPEIQLIKYNYFIFETFKIYKNKFKYLYKNSNTDYIFNILNKFP